MALARWAGFGAADQVSFCDRRLSTREIKLRKALGYPSRQAIAMQITIDLNKVASHNFT
jgi:hypothetical protein